MNDDRAHNVPVIAITPPLLVILSAAQDPSTAYLTPERRTNATGIGSRLHYNPTLAIALECRKQHRVCDDR